MLNIVNGCRAEVRRRKCGYCAGDAMDEPCDWAGWKVEKAWYPVELQLGQIDLLICAMEVERLKKLGLNVFLY